MPDGQVGRFLIRQKLGHGGMGEVYRADDPVLNRPVALKILKPSAAPDRTARDRLLAEARAAAALDHPNICTIFEVGETPDGGLFIAMALYEGETLAARVTRGPMPPAEASAIAVQIAKALSHAHTAGVVHRDVKPANVMLTADGLAKLLDFGIASRMDETRMTGEPLIVGTLAYMSPEQVRGSMLIDGRTDAWALGVTLYEMIAGHLPFEARSADALAKAILSDEPRALARENARALEPLLLGLLEKDPERRWTIAEFLEAMAPETAAAHPTAEALIVLPFENISPERDTEYFADGLTDEIITTLSTSGALKVISRRSAMHYKGTTLKLREIARQVGARHVLEGSVRRAGNSLRITAHLVDASTETEIWADKYSGTLDDVFDIQERVGLAIAGSLRVRLGPDAGASVGRTMPADAYDLYLRARNEIWRFTASGIQVALPYVDRALAIAGDHPTLLAARAQALWQLVNLGGGEPALLGDAGRMATRALELDGRSVPALRVLALIAALRGDTAQADELFTRALQYGSSDVETLLSACFFYCLVGGGQRAVDLGRRASELDPLYSVHWAGLAYAEACVGRDAEAAAAAGRALEVDPHDLMTRVVAPLLVNGRGDLDATLRMLHETDRNDEAPGWYGVLANVTYSALRRDRDRVFALVTPALEQFFGLGVHNAFYAAEIFSLVDDNARSLRFLRRAVELGLGCYPMVATHSRALASVRAQPEFAEALGEIERAWRRRQMA